MHHSDSSGDDDDNNNSNNMDCDYLATSYPWSMLWCMLFNDYTDVLSWHACRARHIVLTLILDLHLIFGHTVTVLVLSTVLQVCNRYPPSVHNTLLSIIDSNNKNISNSSISISNDYNNSKLYQVPHVQY
jgi:hypothetical protein